MAVILEGWGVVARRSVVESKLAGGFEGWFEIVPSRMACADRDLCFVAFMTAEDAYAFVQKLDALGLTGERNGVFRDVALVGRDGVWTHMCPWLRIGTYGGVNAVWMEGSDPEPLVVQAHWRPNLITNFTHEEAAQRLQFIRREGNVDVYLDTETGEEMYQGQVRASARDGSGRRNALSGCGGPDRAAPYL